MFKPIYDFEWNMLEIYNYNYSGKFDSYFNYLRQNIDKDGDLIEAGVFRGSSLLSVALFLKEIDSPKRVYGYDSFEGFPPVHHENDSVNNFIKLFENGEITKDHLNQYQSSKKIRDFIEGSEKVDADDISTSGNFSNTNKDLLQKKIEFLELDNIILVDGSFEDTMNDGHSIKPDKILGGIIDCDLYNSYKSCLDFFWPLLIDTGELYLDEYYSIKFPGALIAVNEFLKTSDATLLKHQVNPKDFLRYHLRK
tara:strand:- start:6291 stop:7046 length:756 start_codon:yes stop_codon:yes gene_type:complete